MECCNVGFESISRSSSGITKRRAASIPFQSNFFKYSFSITSVTRGYLYAMLVIQFMAVDSQIFVFAAIATDITTAKVLKHSPQH